MNKLEIIYNRGYRVSKNGDMLRPDGSIIKGTINKDGYKQTGIRIDGKTANIHFHRLQGFQKFGKQVFDKTLQIRHLNSNPLDNSWDNIGIGTPVDNAGDKDPEIARRAALHASSYIIKYNKDEVREYYKDNGWAKTKNHFNISSSGTLHYILKGKKQ